MVVCDWPSSAEAMSFCFQTCCCSELLVLGYRIASIAAGGYACFYTVL